MKSAGSIVLAIVVAGTFAGGGLLHAIVPHAHMDEHDSTHESSIWKSLHQAINHEDKKILLAIVVAAVVIAMALVETRRTSFAYEREVSPLARALNPSTGELLRRGIHPYRRFA